MSLNLANTIVMDNIQYLVDVIMYNLLYVMNC